MQLSLQQQKRRRPCVSASKGWRGLVRRWFPQAMRAAESQFIPACKQGIISPCHQQPPTRRRLAAFVGGRCAIPSSILECRLCESYVPADKLDAMEPYYPHFIIGNNVLAHVPDINDFVAGIRH